MNSTFEVGDRVKVEFTGTVTSTCGHNAGYDINGPGGWNHEVFMSDMAIGDEVVMKRADPENWPPQANDVWYSPSKASYFHVFTCGVIRRTGFGGVQMDAEMVLRDYPDVELKFRV
jgi:hypothetical protein